MNRRNFVTRLTALVPALLSTRPSPYYGAVTVERHAKLRAQGIFLRVYVYGEDVTGRCRFADDRPWCMRAELFKLNAEGKPYVVDNHVALEIATEGVVIRPGEPPE